MILKRRASLEIILPEIKRDIATVIKTVLTVERRTCSLVEQSTKPRNRSAQYAQLIFDKNAKNKSIKETSLQQVEPEQIKHL